MYRLIIADDEPLIREGLRRRNDWHALGYDVAAVLEDGGDVLHFLEQQRADVLLTDIRMFQVSGLEVARLIGEKYPWMKVILLSGYREFEYAKEAMHCGVYEYLLKPIDFAELRKVFTRLRTELDNAQREETLLRSFGETEYNQLVALIRMVSCSVLDEGEEETWLAYARMKPLMREAPGEVRQIIVRRLLEQLRADLQKKNLDLADGFREKLEALGSNPGENCAEKVSAVLRQLNDDVVASQGAAPRRFGRDDSIMKARKYISNHLSEDFSYKDVADFVHLSPRHFIRRFQTEQGETFTNYLIRVRMENAMKLLAQKKFNADDICRAVGYHDEKYFRQLFKKYAGCSVRDYVQEHSADSSADK